MNVECLRIADQLRRAFAGDAWHGPPLSEILGGMTFEQARSRPFPTAHNIWEIVLHIDVYVVEVLNATRGIPMRELYGTEKDWPPAGKTEHDWNTATQRLFANGEALASAIAEFSDARLTEVAAGRDYDFYYLFHGIIQHSLYHGGQIAQLKRAVLQAA